MKKDINYYTSKFIADSKRIYGDRFDYSKTVYTGNTHEKVDIFCKKHQEFFSIAAYRHTGNCRRSCGKCTEEQRLINISGPGMSTEEFVNTANILHNNKYTYEKTIYQGDKKEVIVTCKEHGDFLIKPNYHIRKKDENNRPSGCKICGRKKTEDSIRLTKEEFVQKSIKIHKDKYDYSEVIYITNDVKVKILCKSCNTHFLQTPHMHVGDKNGCPICSSNKSESEDNLEKILIDLGINYIKNDRTKLYNESSKRYLETDFLCNDFNLGIEVHGNFWHSEHKMSKEKAKNHMLDKYLIASKSKINLLQLYDSDIISNEDKVRNLLSILLVESKINGKNCMDACLYASTIKGAELKEIVEFISKNSLEEIEIDGVVVLLRYRNKIKALATFNGSMMASYIESENIKDGLEYCISSYLSSSLNISPNDILYFISNNMLGCDSKLLKCGFIREETLEPSFLYTSVGSKNGYSVITKEEYLLLEDDDKDKCRKYARIWNAGSTLWKLKLCKD